MKQRSDGRINGAANATRPANVSVPSVSVAYEVIRYTDKNGTTSENVHGSMITRVSPPVTEIDGMSRAFLRLGTEEGVYTVRARCEACVSGQEQIATGIAHNYDVTAAVETVLAGDPNANEDDCPSGCCPRTPVLQITGIAQPDGLASFTSAGFENTLDLHARVLPTCLLSQSDITWQVADAPGDYIESLRDGVSIIPPAGQDSGFSVLPENLPDAPQGRPLPLAYKVTAGVNKLGTMLYASKVIKQDEIDKCRQEYIDWDNGDLGKQLTYAPRSKFIQGIAGDFDRYKDCYANIYPMQEAQVAFSLRNAGHALDITSGYRSPRHNMLTVQSSTSSPHLFGDAVDIVPVDKSPAGWQALWESPEATCPKVLEYNKRDTILFCGSDGIIYEGKAFPLTGAESKDDPRVFSIQKNCIHLGELKH